MSGFNWEAARFFIDGLQFIGVFGVAIFAVMTSRSKANTSAIDDIDERVDGHEKRIVEIEKDIEHGPNRGDLAKMHRRMDKLVETTSATAAQVEGIAATVTGVKGVVDLLNEHHLKGEK